ncbi:ArgP/LysG family DNA-binding transcriptional regulator [Massilia violaceinigra]|uniref:ArgP/LysG family DNA-binding transcriptional regulator n=1 Tax=Massilia violaceinigra TaxID=2045208 RepID=A0ABY4AAY4_9BURK|nr:ArgP/LysG family DNA-binding transcriptional regulator [Massilia violaceinigra]UOD31969.1 ArgP/LysG family DNA-binding transcriptional regulator [Massilia violaceinigra]
MNNLDYRGLAVLDAVAASGSFDKAALLLGMSQSAVSQRIKALEDSCGRLLVVRGAPSVPTGLGQRLVVHFRHVKLMEAALDIDLGRATSLPALALALDADSLATWFAQALPALLSPPRCQFNIELADGERALRLVREGAAFACVAEADGSGGGGEAAVGTSATPLGLLRYTCVATPAFAGHWFGDGFIAEAVALAPAVVSERKQLARFLAQEFGGELAFPHHTMPVSAALENCILHGVAYGLMPELSALSLIAAGQLIDLAPGRTWSTALAWHAWNIDTPFTRALTEHIVTSARRYLPQPPPGSDL